jgi:Ubiquitin family
LFSIAAVIVGRPRSNPDTSRDLAMATEGSAPNVVPEKFVQLHIKNPTDGSGTSPFIIETVLSKTVGELKSDISVRYPMRPEASNQRLIFAGKLLRDDAALGNVLAGVDTSAPQTFHLVISAPTHVNVSGSTSSQIAEPPGRSPNDDQASNTQHPPGVHTDAPQFHHAGPPMPGDIPFGFQAGTGFLPNGAYAPAIHPYPGNMYYAPLPAPLLPEGPATRGVPVLPFIAPGNFPIADARHQIHGPYGNVGAIDPTYLAHLEAMQQRFAQEMAAHHHQHMYHQQQQANIAPHFHPQPGPEGNVHLGAGAGLVGGMGHGHAVVAPVNGPQNAGALGNNINGPWVRQYVFQFELNWSLISKLILLVVLLGQEGSSQRLYALGSSAVLIYLWQTGRLGVIRRLANIVLPDPAHLFELVVPARAPADSEQREPRINRTVIAFSHVYSFLYGFVCSLLPSWEPMQLPRMDAILNENRNMGNVDIDQQNVNNEDMMQGNRDVEVAPDEIHHHAD